MVPSTKSERVLQTIILFISYIILSVCNFTPFLKIFEKTYRGPGIYDVKGSLPVLF